MFDDSYFDSFWFVAGRVPVRLPDAARVAYLAPMVIVLPNGRVNRIPRIGGNLSKMGIPAIFRRATAKRVYAGFIAILKLPFKFDRS